MGQWIKRLQYVCEDLHSNPQSLREDRQVAPLSVIAGFLQGGRKQKQEEFQKFLVMSSGKQDTMSPIRGKVRAQTSRRSHSFPKGTTSQKILSKHMSLRGSLLTQTSTDILIGLIVVSCTVKEANVCM